jgi:hypothetical protein
MSEDLYPEINPDTDDLCCECRYEAAEELCVRWQRWKSAYTVGMICRRTSINIAGIVSGWQRGLSGSLCWRVIGNEIGAIAEDVPGGI